jgi:uncharacterized protein YjbI with pentapeptide repeats
VLVGCFANLDSVLLQGTDLRGADLDYASLVDTVLEHGNMESMRIRHAHFSFADLTACRMSQAVFDHCTFDDCTWKGADLRGAQFLHCDFSSNRNQLGAQLAALATEPDDEGMAGLILKGALFVDCRLGQMNFKGKVRKAQQFLSSTLCTRICMRFRRCGSRLCALRGLQPHRRMLSRRLPPRLRASMLQLLFQRGGSGHFRVGGSAKGPPALHVFVQGINLHYFLLLFFLAMHCVFRLNFYSLRPLAPRNLFPSISARTHFKFPL